jgi:hypothetical protein
MTPSSRAHLLSKEKVPPKASVNAVGELANRLTDLHLGRNAFSRAYIPLRSTALALLQRVA